MESVLIIVHQPDAALETVARELSEAGATRIEVVTHGVEAAFRLLCTRNDLVLVEATEDGGEAIAAARMLSMHKLLAPTRLVALVGPEGPESHGSLRAAGVDDVVAAPPTASGWRWLLHCLTGGAATPAALTERLAG